MKKIYLSNIALAKLHVLLSCLFLAANSIKAQTPAITEEWVQIWNGTDSLMDQATAIGADGFIYVCGMSVSGTTDGDYVVLKYSPAGALIWSVIYNGADNLKDGAVAITTDANSNVYVTGSSNSAVFTTDIVTLKIDPSGTILWEHRYNGTANGNDEPEAIKTDASGNIYVLGGTNS